MRRTLFNLFLLIQLSTHLFGANYYCGTDDGYVKYLQGAGTLDGVTSYNVKDNCSNNCKTYNHCDTKKSTETLFPINGAIKLNEADKIKFEGLMAGRNISNILINSNGTAGTYDFSSSPINGNLFKFPTTFSDDLSNPTVTNVIFSRGADSISLKSVQEVTKYQASCDSNNTLVGSSCKRDDNSTYSPHCASGGSLTDTMCYKLSGTKYYQVSATKNGNDISMVSSSTYIDPNTEQQFNSSFYLNAEAILTGYTCTKLKGQIQNGDLGHNFFSSNNVCETNCVVQNDCFALSEEEEGCEVTDLQYTNPVTDYTGKTVYSQMHKTLKCTKTATEQTGCDAYKLSNSYNTVNYDLSSIGYRYNTYSGLEEAATTSLMSEQMQHLFSGWKGKCEYGMMFNNPFNDPMKILSYAMMAYSAAGDAAGAGEAAGEASGSAVGAGEGGTGAAAKTGAFDSAADATNNSMTEASGYGSSTAEASNSMAEASGYGQAVVVDASANAAETTMEMIERWNTAWTDNIGGVQLTLKWSAIASAATSLAYPPKEDYIAADKLLKSWMGSSDQDAGSFAYVQCMASIGLSFPNLASWSAGDSGGMSPELQVPYKNPLRLTDSQVAILIAATSEKFVKSTLFPVEVNGDSMTYVALTALTYYQVGQVICGGKLAIAANIAVAQATPAPKNGGGGANVGMIAAKTVISMLPPPYNLIASVILDIVTSFKSGNACTDKEIAMKWGLDQYKTNMFVNYDQCHYVSTKCAAKWFWGSCMRQRNSYCCYDQIITRIMMEGIKPQLGLNWESCNDISINDLKNISFQPCKASQDPYLDHCFPKDKYNEFIEAMKVQASKGLATQTLEDVVNQAINSMAIPGKNLEEICTDCH